RLFLGCGSGTHREPPSIWNLGVQNRLKPELLAGLGRKPIGTHQRDVLALHCRIGACDGSRPYPGDDVRLATTLILGQSYLGIQMPDAFNRPLSDERAIVPNIGSKPLRPLPGIGSTDCFAINRIHWRRACPAWGNLQIALVEQNSDRIEIGSVRLEAQSVRFERDSAASRKGIEDDWQLSIALL